jgi:HPt (histidine-containing phosphotransfer) domain-containing protein
MVFDLAHLLLRLLGDHDLLDRIVEAFLSDMPRQIQKLKDLLSAGDAPGLERQAHSIKGAAANLGGGRLEKVARQMEQAANAGDLRTVQALMAELETHYSRLSETIAGETTKSP